jgi:hypothetical protein
MKIKKAGIMLKWEVNPDWRSLSIPTTGDFVQLKFEEYLINAKYIESFEENEIQVKIKTILYTPVNPIQTGNGEITQLIARKVIVKQEQIWKLIQNPRNLKITHLTQDGTEAVKALPVPA